MLGGHGPRDDKFVWSDGKPPRYWVVSALLFVAFVLLWLLALLNLDGSGRPVQDSFHSLAVLEDSHLRFYPAFLFWLVHRGLLLIMAWMLAPGLVMAFKRKKVRNPFL